MRKVLFSVLLLTTVLALQGQLHSDSDSRRNKELTGLLYQKKTERQKTNAMILGITGGLIATVGGIITISQLSDISSSPSRSYSNTGEVMGTIGSVMVLGSIPFFIASGTNKKKAKIYMGYQPSLLYSPMSKGIASIGFAIQL